MSKKIKKVNIKQELHENNIDHIVHEHAGKVIEENQLAYSDLVITGRAIPSQFDGMKPVHRRLFSSFKSNNLINKNIKSARIVGECLVKDTLISTNKGFIPIQNIEVGDQVHTQNGLKNVSALFHQPKQKLLKITLKGGVFINTSTFKHKYKTVNKSGELVFQEAEKFQVGDKLILEASRTDLKSALTEEESLELSHRLLTHGLDNELLEILNLLSIKNLEDFIRGCYIYSLFLPDGCVVDKNKYRDTLIPYKDINLVRQLAYLLFDRLGLYSKLHEDGLLLDNVTHDSKYRLEEIESIEEVAEEETYDFTVDDEHEFFANCVVSSNCIGKLHPHGDVAVYDALIEMTQTFKNRTPLTIGQGNMGSISGDSQAAMRYCVTGDTRVPTAKGMVKIADIVKSKPNSEQDIDEVIYSIDGKLNKADKFFNSGKHDIFYLRAENGQEIKGSSNHPLLVLTSNAEGRPFFKWKTLSEIKEGEYLCVDRGLKYDLYSGIKQKSKNDDLLAGLLIGATKTDKHYIIDVKEKEKVLKSVGFKINGDKASIKIKKVGSFSNKKISDEIFSMSYKEKATFLRTVFKRLYTDKLILKNKLLRDIQLLLLDFCVVTNVVGKELNFYEEIDKKSFSIRILKIKHKSDDFIELPPYVGDFLYANNLELTDDEASDIFNLVNNSYSYVKVAFIEELPVKDYVYSIRVDNECHSFTANGFVNHNTEIKLPTDSADMLFDNFEKDVFPTVPNYDDTIQEPSLLPVKFPLAILNGTTGVAYAGITSKIPSYNINELRNLYVYIIDNQLYKNHLTHEHREEIMKIIPTVDLPTGCNVYFEDENDSIFSPQFKFRMRATHHFEDDKTITFTKVPTDMTLDRIVEQAKNAGLSYKMVNGKKVNKTEDEILNISENIDIVSRSSFNDNDYKNDAEITFTFKKGSNLNLELIKIYKYTDLDSSYSAKLRFIDENSCPVYLSLYQQSLRFLEFRLHVFYKAYMYDIDKLAHQLHMLYGLVAIYDDLDTFIHIVKNADDSEMYALIKMKFDLDDSQIEYLLNIQLRKLSKTSVDNIKADIEQKEIKKADLETKIASEDSLYQVIKEDYKNMKFKRAERLTEIIQANRNISKEDMIEDKEVIVMYMEDDTIAYVEKSKFRLKNKGTKTTENKINNDFELNLKITESCRLKDELLLMTNFGRVFRLQAFEFGEQFRFIGNILNLNKDEKLINIMKNESSEFYSVITKDGKIKGISGDIFKNTTSNRAITVIKLDDKDSVIGFSPYKEEDMVLLLTDFGRVMKYPATEINVYGGAAKGTRAATLKGKEILIKSFIFKETNESVLIGVSNTGKAKKTLTKKISIKNRTSAPNLFFNNSDENGNLVCGEVLEEDKEVLMLLTQRADVSIIKTSGFNDVSRTAKGSINLIKMQDGEFVKLCKKIELSELSDTQNQIVIEDEESL